MTEGTARRRRRPAALDSRIVASGVAACATFGMVIGMAVSRPPEQAVAQDPVGPAVTATSPPRRDEVIVIKRRYVPVAGDTDAAASSSSTGTVTAPAPAPVPAPAPPATTSGGS